MMWPCWSLPFKLYWPGTLCWLFSGVMGGGSLSMPASFADACQTTKTEICSDSWQRSAQDDVFQGNSLLSPEMQRWSTIYVPCCINVHRFTCFASLGSRCGQVSSPSAIWSKPAGVLILPLRPAQSSHVVPYTVVPITTC